MAAWTLLAMLQVSAPPPTPALPDLDRVIRIETGLERCPKSADGEIVVCGPADAPPRHGPDPIAPLPEPDFTLDDAGLLRIKLGRNLELVGGGRGAGLGLRLRF